MKSLTTDTNKNSKSKKLSPSQVIVSLNEQKHAEYKRILERSNFKTMRALLKHVLENKKVMLVHRDATMDQIIWELAALRKDIQLMAINMNQAAIRMSQEQFSEHVLAEAKVLEQLCESLEAKVPSLFDLITKIANIWLPK